ncbi:tRNA (guanosine(37)-N1)-methyltransferase TrmD [Nocardioides zeae]|uniref:tRNA (guanine-N(1)-)-methyltransferase n=1 Tax=Nocardioides imazamoxiresistens TaxID=3231893 RepID=A0ABU3PYL5_9ACTN|nr:tRNA (guanosine(37)-N1)-methyltransferase TrmD [Nocardioides zeae]MDT9593880.1 tRNA (guanosine(37)-N1)-methyltransferase TrmD [Nocardioides zeae]
MRIDVLSIFPDYLRALDLSLPGRAQRSGLLDLRVHDLRTWTHDRHRTVDDTPYGGGAGMVMKPEPWGEAFDEIGLEGAVLLVPTPSGEVFRQSTARELAGEERLVIACGRYEGIDARVVEHAAAGGARVREVSIGDYVLNGGEVAALAVVEAVVRLLPGFMGNPSSLVEESHEDGLLEYPVYTKPPTWRGLDVPDVLRGGDHGAIERWRRERALERTARRRPDLLPVSQLAALGEYDVATATAGDAGELWTLSRACWVAEAQANPGVEIPALHEDLDDVLAGLGAWTTLVARSGGRLVASVRGRLDDGAWDVGRLMVAPDLQGRGIGRRLLGLGEELAAPHVASGEVRAYRLVTGAGSEGNLRMYRKAGYRVVGPAEPGALRLEKPVR